MHGWKISHILYLIAIIAVVIGVIIGFGVGIKNGSELNENDQHNVTRANLFFLAAVAIGVLALVQWGYEKYGMEHSHVTRHKVIV